MFEELIKANIHDKNCFIIGTPDVNPVAEIILAKLKGITCFKNHFSHNPKKINKRNLGKFKLTDTFIPFKNHLLSYYTSGDSGFYIQFDSKDPLRGFLYWDKDGKYIDAYKEVYVPREKFPDKNYSDRWNLLGHLIIAPNPFSERFPDTDFKVVFLMGIGGPATLGIAHLLTGRPTDSNKQFKWDRNYSKNFVNNIENYFEAINSHLLKDKATEAIIKINVINDKDSKNHKYEDTREINSIELEDSLPGIVNPKSFYFVDNR